MSSLPFGIRSVTICDAPALEAARGELSRRDRAGLDAPDGELLAFASGLKRLLKRERLTARWAERLRSGPWLAGADVRLFRGEREDDVTLFAAREPALLDRVLALEAEERRPGGHRARVIAAFGEALGYPACCARAFASAAVHDDASVLARLLPSGAWGALPWPSNPFVPGVSLVTHYACHPGCAESRAQGLALFERLAVTEPARAERARRLLTAPLVLFDRFRLVALEGATFDGDDVAWERAWLPFEGTPEPACATDAAARLFLTHVAPLFAASDRLRRTVDGLRLTRAGSPVADVSLAPGAPPWLVAPRDEP